MLPDLTQMVRASGTLKVCVCNLQKPFGMQKKTDFPEQKYQRSQNEKTEAEKAFGKSHGGEHHDGIPIVDAAGVAAAVFHQKMLEWAIVDYTDKITYIEYARQDDQTAFVDDMELPHDADNSCQQEPGDCGFDCLDIGFANMFANHIFGGIGYAGFEPSGKLPEFRTVVQPAEGQELCDQIDDPHGPEDMQHGKPGSKSLGFHDFGCAGEKQNH